VGSQGRAVGLWVLGKVKRPEWGLCGTLGVSRMGGFGGGEGLRGGEGGETLWVVVFVREGGRGSQRGGQSLIEGGYKKRGEK